MVGLPRPCLLRFFGQIALRIFEVSERTGCSDVGLGPLSYSFSVLTERYRRCRADSLFGSTETDVLGPLHDKPSFQHFAREGAVFFAGAY